MSNSPETPKEKKPIDSTVLAAIIGGIVTITVTAITVFANRPAAATPVPVQVTVPVVVTATNVPVIPTDTVPAGNPTSTPAPIANTPVPTFTFTAAPVLEAGKDWQQNCISTAWQVYPVSTTVSDKDGCYVNFLDGFAVRNQQLTIYINKPMTTQDTIGMFVAIPSDGLVNLNIHLNNIDSSELRMGIFQEPDVTKPGVMVAVPAGNPKNSAFAVESVPSSGGKYITDKFKKDSGDYLITFDIATGSVIVKFEKYTSVKPVNVPSDANGKKWLFIGYKTLVGKTNVLDASFFDLTIASR